MGTDIHAVAECYRDGRWHLVEADIPRDRNYRAFAVLADVRNGYSFAGIGTGDPVTPIDEPRGLPDDLSPELRAALEQKRWLLGDHSISWVTLEELLAYDLDAPVTFRAYVPQEEAAHLRETGEPPRMTAAYSADPSWVRIEWRQPLREQAWLISALIEALRPLGTPSRVRLVFGFDC